MCLPWLQSTKGVLILCWLCIGFISGLKFAKRYSEKEVKSVLQLELVLISNRLIATSVQEPAGNMSILKRKTSYLLIKCDCRFTCLASANGVAWHIKTHDEEDGTLYFMYFSMTVVYSWFFLFLYSIGLINACNLLLLRVRCKTIMIIHIYMYIYCITLAEKVRPHQG